MKSDFTHTELIEHQTITAIVENVEQAKADARRGLELLIGARARLKAVLGDYHDDVIKDRLSNFSLDAEGDAIKESEALITKNAWSYVIQQTGLRHFMTERRQSELREQIDKGQLPPLTVENVVGTLQGLAGKIDGLLMESVKEVFDWLRPQAEWSGAKYKTNQKWKVGPKVIVTWACDAWYGSGGFHIRHGSDGKFRTLGNVFSLLDGKGVQKYPDDLCTRFDGCFRKPGAEKYEDEYFEMRCYGNMNVHIRFKRLDLVAKLNQIAGGEGLPGEEPNAARA